ncbi:MAG: hypothetical protein JWM82_1862 [Myxococcales bacterium]|nr:hypothetical protein [Myxococcales bacterium]
MNRKLGLRSTTVAAVLFVVALAVPARAQTGTAGTTGTTSFADADFFIGVQATNGVNLSTFDLPKFFNKGNCDCSTPVWVYTTLTASGFAKRALVQPGTIEVLVGTNCNMPIYRAGCTALYSDQITTFFALGRNTAPTNARVLSRNTSTTLQVDGGVSTDTTADCSGNGIGTGFSQPIWINMDFGADGTIDFSTSTSIQIDLTPPPAPTNVKVAGGNEALTVTWTDIDFATNPDLQGYQVLCRREADEQVFKDNTFGAYYKSARTYCPKTTTAAPGIEGLDPLFACSPLLTRSTGSYRVKILENKVWYAAAVVAIDNSGNAAAPVLNGFDPTFMNPTNFAQPAPTLSFYQQYRKGDTAMGGPQTSPPGAASGGFCAVATSTRRPWPIVLAVGGALALAGLRRRRRK